MYKDCINKQKQLEREKSDKENIEEPLIEEKIIDAERDVEKSDNNKPTKKRKRKQIKVRIYNFDSTYVIMLHLG